VSAFLVALLGGVHCTAMCGGIVAALTLGLPAGNRFSAILPYLLAYNLGRISSYTVAGVLAGGMGSWAANLALVHHGQQILQGIAGLFMVMLGLYLAGWWRGLARLEQVGGILWQHLKPLGQRMLPLRRPGQALIMGMIWGWLPCGLVYSVLIWAISAGSGVNGGLLMLSFGLGTLPALLAMGAFATALTAFTRRPAIRHSAGILVMGFGLYQLTLAMS